MNKTPLVEFVRDIYQTNDFIPLHAPTFDGNEQNYVLETIQSTFVSSVGKFVDEFEQKIEAYKTKTHGAGMLDVEKVVGSVLFYYQSRHVM